MNAVHPRKDKSSSGSSDLGSENSSDEDGPNKICEHKIVKQLSLHDNQFVKEQIDNLLKRNAELESQTISMHAKLEEIQHQAGGLVDELQTTRNSFKLFDVENVFLKEEIGKSKEQEGTLHLQLSSLWIENEILKSEKEKFSSMVLQNDKSIIELKSDLEKTIGDTGKLRQENSSLKEELEGKNQNLVYLNEQIVLMSGERENFRAAATAK
ncbi:hypothetical protein KSP40_PGU014429 [Platanthera guangdongensis]|uniref:Uncharacterized protein n=1 Tax=Platanthera guangdongensis TaxID=2320717 RepID=A0ABR2LDE2_9ASPA